MDGNGLGMATLQEPAQLDAMLVEIYNGMTELHEAEHQQEEPEETEGVDHELEEAAKQGFHCSARSAMGLTHILLLISLLIM